MKYACNKCLKVAEETETKGWLEVTIRAPTPKYADKKILICNDCRPGFWKSVCSGFGPEESEHGKS